MEQRIDSTKYKRDLLHALKNEYLSFKYRTEQGIKDKPLIYWPDYTDSINFNLFESKNNRLQAHAGSITEREDDIVDSLIAKDPVQKRILATRLNFWIIDKYRDSLIGPMDKFGYLATREHLQISSTLKLSFEKSK